VKPKPWSRRLADRPVWGRAEYPIGTIAFYGPTNRHASKAAVGIVRGPRVWMSWSGGFSASWTFESIPRLARKSKRSFVAMASGGWWSRRGSSVVRMRKALIIRRVRNAPSVRSGTGRIVLKSRFRSRSNEYWSWAAMCRAEQVCVEVQDRRGSSSGVRFRPVLMRESSHG
jgi:hypothetical protein